MASRMRGTLLKPPPLDPDKSLIENMLEVVEVGEGSNIFTNRREAWHPPGARGIYGGTVIAMCLVAAQKTVPAIFAVHSLHCYFLLAGSSELPILFHVEKVRDGRSFATRTVQARQHGRCIFTTTMSFVHEGAGGPAVDQVRHASPMPTASSPLEGEKEAEKEPLRPPPDDWAGDKSFPRPRGQNDGNSPLQHYRTEVTNRASGQPHLMRSRQWVRARGRIAGGHEAHLAALAYLSDSWFIGTVQRVHGLWRWPFTPAEAEAAEEAAEEGEGGMVVSPEVRDWARHVNMWEEGMDGDLEAMKNRRAIGMMVSLDHTVYFHQPRRFRADEWMFSEMATPWAGDGRGLVTQQIFARDGTLLATCYQEGVIRLQPETQEKKESKL